MSVGSYILPNSPNACLLGVELFIAKWSQRMSVGSSSVF